jgi:hypothetical protein
MKRLVSHKLAALSFLHEKWGADVVWLFQGGF